MEKITFVIDKNKDADLLISIAKKLGIRKYSITKPKPTSKEKAAGLKKLLNTLEARVDVSNFGDPSKWQRKTRKDRSINL